MSVIPVVIESDSRGDRVYDVYSRLLKDRIIFLGHDINDAVANAIVAQLLLLSSESDDGITIYINSRGGHISDGLAIIDTMNYVSAPITTVCIGMAASMAAVILSAGTRGKRFALPNSEILIHQPRAYGLGGQTTDIDLQAKHIIKLRDKMDRILAKNTKQKVSKITIDTERDFIMDADEAIKYGIIDKIIEKNRVAE